MGSGAFGALKKVSEANDLVERVTMDDDKLANYLESDEEKAM